MQRCSSKESNRTTATRDQNPMSESTMYFLKQVYSKDNKEKDQGDFYQSVKKGDSQFNTNISSGSKLTDEENDQNFGSLKTPMSLLKSRRSTNKKINTKENTSPSKHNMLAGTRGVNASCDIHSLIETFHNDSAAFNSDFKQRMNGAAPSNNSI